MVIETISSREARTKWRDVLDKVMSRRVDVVIERSGKPVAVMISVEDYKMLRDELDDLRAAQRAADAYEEWKRDPSTARSYAEIRKEMVRDGLLDE
jgi:prevent-host-death family protein